MNPIIASARSFIGTRFHHQGRLKKTGNHRGGIDCLGLLVGVAHECNVRSKTGELLADVDEFNYPHYPDTIRLREMLERHLISLPLKGGGIREAGIALFEIDGRAQHMGIIANIPVPLREGLGEGWLPRNDDVNFNAPPPTQPSPSRGEGFHIIHAYAPARAVVEHALDDYWRERMVGLFRLNFHTSVTETSSNCHNLMLKFTYCAPCAL